MWLDGKTGEVIQYGDMLQFTPVLKQHIGQYYCLAQNSVGNSSLEAYNLDVLCKVSVVRWHFL